MSYLARLHKEVYETERMAITAIPYIPKKSKYRSWCYQLLAEEIPALKYRKLRERLIKFHSQA